jgi:hypothetical protein
MERNATDITFCTNAERRLLRCNRWKPALHRLSAYARLLFWAPSDSFTVKSPGLRRRSSPGRIDRPSRAWLYAYKPLPPAAGLRVTIPRRGIGSCNPAVIPEVAEACKTGQIGGYGGDVWYPQPAPKDHPWRTMPYNAMVPHISGTSLSAQAYARDSGKFSRG